MFAVLLPSAIQEHGAHLGYITSMRKIEFGFSLGSVPTKTQTMRRLVYFCLGVKWFKRAVVSKMQR